MRGEEGRPGAVVIGAGLAGLAAACRLSVRGWRVEVLEREPRPGGRCVTVADHGFLFDTGAQYFRDSYDSALKKAIELTLGERFRVPAERPGVYLGGRVNLFAPRSLNPGKLLPWRALGGAAALGVPRVALSLLSRYRSYNVRFARWWRAGDDLSASRFLSSRSSGRFSRGFAEPACLYALGAGTEELSAAAMFVALRMLLADRTISFTTGAGTLADALAARLDVTTGALVTEVLVESGAARGVAYQKEGKRHETRADVVVSAVPPAAALRCCPSLGRAAAAAGAPRSDAVVVNAGFDRLLEGPAGPVLLPAGEGFDAAWACTNRSKAFEYAPEGSSVLTVVFSGTRATDMLGKSDDGLLDAALSDASRLYPGRLAPTRFRVDRHEDAWPVASVGYSGRTSRLAEEGSGVRSLYLAGDWTGSPTMEGAVASGFDAAERAAVPADRLH